MSFDSSAALSRDTTAVLTAFLTIVGAYLLGSISFAMLVSRAFGLPDPHEYGSGNPGATNVLRTGNKKAALLTLVGDAAKGWLGVFLALAIATHTGAPYWIVPLAALAVFIGHLFPVYYRFRGGKGVATAAGIVFALHWPFGVALLAIWAVIAFGFKISSLAALVAAALLPLGAFWFFGNTMLTWSLCVISALLFWRHRANIRQLVAGNERVIGR